MDETERKAAAFDQILAIYHGLEVDDAGSDWVQGSEYDNVVTRYLGIPTWFNGLDEEN